MAIENAAKDAQGLGQWIAQCGAALVFYGLIDKFRRGGPVKKLEGRMDNLEKSVNDKFDQLTSQRVLDVASLKSEFASHSVKLAELTTALNAQTKAFDNLVNRFDKREGR
ncbi:hypothetical protein KW797_04750 [Candidatus Parcubacteria bacterium]|nr:hypothetical protein [Candidatus Parcubacteria bacterium]